MSASTVYFTNRLDLPSDNTWKPSKSVTHMKWEMFCVSFFRKETFISLSACFFSLPYDFNCFPTISNTLHSKTWCSPAILLFSSETIETSFVVWSHEWKEDATVLFRGVRATSWITKFCVNFFQNATKVSEVRKFLLFICPHTQSTLSMSIERCQIN